MHDMLCCVIQTIYTTRQIKAKAKVKSALHFTLEREARIISAFLVFLGDIDQYLTRLCLEWSDLTVRHDNTTRGTSRPTSGCQILTSSLHAVSWDNAASVFSSWNFISNIHSWVQVIESWNTIIVSCAGATAALHALAFSPFIHSYRSSLRKLKSRFFVKRFLNRIAW